MREIPLPRFVRRFLRRIYNVVWYDMLLEIPAIRIRRDRAFLSAWYALVVGRPLRLNPPVTLGEKITHRMLYQRNPLHSMCADKYAVRSYVADRVGEKHLPALFAHCDGFSDIDFSTLPVPCIIKTNHGCGGHVIITDVTTLDKVSLKAQLEKSLRSNYYREAREYHYKCIRPCIIAEELLVELPGCAPTDYKFHVFHGRFEFLQVDSGRSTEHRRTYFDRDLRPMSTLGRVPLLDPAWRMPLNINRMVAVAETLGHEFDFVRVDLYNIFGRIVFGELTFTPHAGRLVLTPSDHDELLGRFWHYP